MEKIQSIERSTGMGATKYTADFYPSNRGNEEVTVSTGERFNSFADADDWAANQAPKQGDYVAIMSTTVLPLDGIYRVSTLSRGTQPDLTGVRHYCGHPDTAALIESFGAVKAELKLFGGLQVGDKALCVPIQQGKSNRAVDGFTSPHQNVTLADLELREIERID